MPLANRTLEHANKLVEGRRRAAFDAIADPLWRAINAGRDAEVARLQGELARLIERHPPMEQDKQA